MTGLQEHPGTGRSLDHQPTGKVDFEAVARALGIEYVDAVDPISDPHSLEPLLRARLASNALSVIIVRRPCLLAAGRIKQYELAAAQNARCDAVGEG
jgi:indolepyruvate ferredoxin oxidoreductase alpha subunit